MLVSRLHSLWLCSRWLTSIFLLTLTTAAAFLTTSFSCCFHNQESSMLHCGLLPFSIIQHANRAVCGFVRRCCFCCWGCETRVQTGVLHWKHGEVPWAAGRRWYRQVCCSHTLVDYQLLRPASIFAAVFQHHHEGEAARGVLPCFPRPGYSNLTDSRWIQPTLFISFTNDFLVEINPGLSSNNYWGSMEMNRLWCFQLAVRIIMALGAFQALVVNCSL